MKCPKCQQENPPRAKFCMECAAPLAQICAGCGTALPAAARFCPQCARPAGPAVERGDAPQAAMPRHLAERILQSRAAIEGERKQVTVLFVVQRVRSCPLPKHNFWEKYCEAEEPLKEAGVRSCIHTFVAPFFKIRLTVA